MEDNLYPTSTQNLDPQEPTAQAVARKKEKAQVEHDYKLMTEAIAYMDAHIQQLDSIAAIPEEIRLDKEKLAIKSEGNAAAVLIISEVKTWMEDLIEQHIRR